MSVWPTLYGYIRLSECCQDTRIPAGSSSLFPFWSEATGHTPSRLTSRSSISLSAGLAWPQPSLLSALAQVALLFLRAAGSCYPIHAIHTAEERKGTRRPPQALLGLAPPLAPGGQACVIFKLRSRCAPAVIGSPSLGGFSSLKHVGSVSMRASE